jgi:hypothetical protein
MQRTAAITGANAGLINWSTGIRIRCIATQAATARKTGATIGRGVAKATEQTAARRSHATAAIGTQIALQVLIGTTIGLRITHAIGTAANGRDDIANILSTMQRWTAIVRSYTRRIDIATTGTRLANIHNALVAATALNIVATAGLIATGTKLNFATNERIGLDNRSGVFLYLFVGSYYCCSNGGSCWLDRSSSHNKESQYNSEDIHHILKDNNDNSIRWLIFVAMHVATE